MSSSIPSRSLQDAMLSIPDGAWGVGVSGGADSVALLDLLSNDLRLRPHVIHLNHETRGAENERDAAWVRDFCAIRSISFTLGRSSDSRLPPIPNPSARHRAARFDLFRRVVQARGLAGVILAHHADDQAETVFQRLLRGAGPTALSGIRPESRVSGMRVLHPLLNATRESLRTHLRQRGIAWREDASNDSPRFLRNRLRSILRARPVLREALLALGRACADWRDWLDRTAIPLPETFRVEALGGFPPPLARHSARGWLRERGAPADRLHSQLMDRFLKMTLDAAAPSRQHFPGGILVRRAKGFLFIEPSASASPPIGRTQ